MISEPPQGLADSTFRLVKSPQFRFQIRHYTFLNVLASRWCARSGARTHWPGHLRRSPGILGLVAPSGLRCGERFHGTPPRDYAQPGRRYAPGASPPPTPPSSPRDPKHSASDNKPHPAPPTAPLPHKSLTPHDTADQHWSDTRKRKNSGLIKSGVKMERATGIEPASEAWEASILPMNYARNSSSRRNRPVDHIVTPDGRATCGA